MDVVEIEKLMQAIVCRTEPTYDQMTLSLAYEAFEDKTDILDKLGVELDKHNLRRRGEGKKPQE